MLSPNDSFNLHRLHLYYSNDFFSLKTVNDGKLEVWLNRMLLGSSVGVDDGKPHTVSVSRNGQSGLISLTVDQGNPSQTVVNQIPGQELQTMDVFLGKGRSR